MFRLPPAVKTTKPNQLFDGWMDGFKKVSDTGCGAAADSMDFQFSGVVEELLFSHKQTNITH